MDIKERSLGLLVKDSGFLQNKGEDYDIWFFDSGKKRSIMQARIVFEGRVKVDEEVIFAGTDSDDVNNVQVREGNEFTDYNKDKMSTIPLAQYMNGPRAALLELLTGDTKNARFSNLGVADEAVVDLNSFNRTGSPSTSRPSSSRTRRRCSRTGRTVSAVTTPAGRARQRTSSGAC